MVSLRCPHYIFFFLLFLLLGACLVDTDTAVDMVCAKTPSPGDCVKCVNQDSSRDTDEIPDLTYAILFCMMSEAVLGHDEADLQAQNTTEPILKQTLQTCNVSLFSASNDLTDSLMRMEGQNYAKAEMDLESGNRGVLDCLVAFQNQPTLAIPPTLSGHVSLAGRYYGVAHVFFSLIPH